LTRYNQTKKKISIIRSMGYSSINEDVTRLDVNQESQHAKLYRQATEEAAFLKSLCVKQDSDVIVPSLPSSMRDVIVPSQPLSIHHQEYALYRQKYLVMYSPFKGKQKDKEFMKKQIKKLFTVNLKKNTKATETN